MSHLRLSDHVGAEGMDSLYEVKALLISLGCSSIQVVSPAVQPRALWAFVPNLELAGSMDTTWMHFMRALAAALSANEDINSLRK